MKILPGGSRPDAGHGRRSGAEGPDAAGWHDVACGHDAARGHRDGRQRHHAGGLEFFPDLLASSHSALLQGLP